MKRNKLIIICCAAAVLLAAAIWLIVGAGGAGHSKTHLHRVKIKSLYGVDPRGYTIEEGTVGQGATLSTILARYGVGASTIDRLERAADSVFPLRGIRAGNGYTLFLEGDDPAARRAAYIVYHRSVTESVVMRLDPDSITVGKITKPVRIQRQRRLGAIESSLWNAMVDGGMSPALAMELSDIYAWSIDFFGLREGDSFTVLYDRQFVDSVDIGTGRIWGAVFRHAGKDYYAIPYTQGAKMQYWDENGNSLRKNLLKAPLSFSRISSRFSNSRLHPVYRIYRPHLGVDYAAPSGTPVYSVADGVVTFRAYKGDNGNMVKVKHPNNLESGYLHLRGFASGLRVGSHVSQGDLIGYVGSTGASTGAHLDFRLWLRGQPIDPLKVPSTPTEPISEQNKAQFVQVRDAVMAAIAGDEPPGSERLDSMLQIAVGRRSADPAATGSATAR